MSDPILKKGAKGADIIKLCELLIEAGLLPSASVDFDKDVAKAVRAFQSAHVDHRGQPLIVDGVVGPLTWRALRTRRLPDAAITIHAPKHFSSLPPGGSAAGRAALAAAIGEMNAGAKEVGANNAGLWVEKYLNGIIPAPANWCAGFTSWCYTHAPGGMPYKYTLGAQATRRYFKQKGWAYDLGEATPEPGDIIVWWRGTTPSWQGHIGLVHHVDDGVIYTIEGNKGAFPAPVRIFSYVASQMEKLLGFGRVPD